MEPLKIYILWHPTLEEGAAVADAVIEHLSALEQRGAGLPIPVRALSSPADPIRPDGPPPTVDPAAAELSVVVALADRALLEAIAGSWRDYWEALAGIVERSGEDDSAPQVFLLNIALEPAALDLPGLEDLQGERAYDWPQPFASPHAIVRLQIQLLRLVWKLLGPASGEPGSAEDDELRVFLSHAKADGSGLADRLRGRMNDTNYGLRGFFDAISLAPGFAYRRQFEREIARSSFLALQTDAYASRPFCRWEMLRAKQHRRPIWTLSQLEQSVPHSFAYAGNGPQSRLGDQSDERIDRLLLDILSETVRCRIWLRAAETAAAEAGLEVNRRTLLPRAVELADLAFGALREGQIDDANPPEHYLIYPDPPVSDDEGRLIAALKRDHWRILTLAQLEAGHVD